MPAVTKMSSKGQVVIPREIRDAARWRQGDTLIVEARDDEVVLRRQSALGPPLTVEEVSGMGRAFYKGPPLTVEEMDRRARERFARDLRR